MAPPPTPTLVQTLTNTTLNLLLPRNPHHSPSNSTFRSDATMSAHDRAIKLRNLTIGWSLSIILACILIGVSIFCILGKRRCCLRPRERDFTGYHVRMGGGAGNNGNNNYSSSIPRVEDFDTRTDAERRDEALWKRWEERDRVRKEEMERERQRVEVQVEVQVEAQRK